ncbi:MAG: molybdopterin-dependent oxidoreductase [Bryobacteraceae bacterium]|nr:molybdopterin-dependent oxidoreductase [Bryobacteraceae bacterium]
MAITRRDLLLFGGGSVAALPFTPIPYKLLDDVSIWTQNFPWLPVPVPGEITLASTTCTLCPAGCGLKVRRVNTRPIGITPAAGHPVSRGTLCPLAFGAHQLAWHPLRLRQSRMNGQDAEPAAIAAKVAEAVGAGKKFAILDERPGRAVSSLYRQAAAKAGGVYLTPRLEEEAPLAAIRALCGEGAPEFGFDLEHARTVLSFGAPLLDGWGVPGAMKLHWKGRETAFIHAGSRFSPTAQLAAKWLPILPGSEAALALGLARVLVDEGLAAKVNGLDHYRALLNQMPLNRAAEITGLKAETIAETARRLQAEGPAVAVGGGDLAGPLGRETEAAIAALNALLGAVGREGGLVARRALAADAADLAPATPLEEADAGSIGVLLVEAATAGTARPWKSIAAKLAEDALVVLLSPYNSGYATFAQAQVATPAFLESLEEAPTAPGAARHSFALAPAVLEAPETAVAPAEFLALVAAEAGWAGLSEATTESACRARAAAIHASKRGSVFSIEDASETKVSEIGSADELYSKLAAGAVWVDDAPAAAAPPAVTLPGAAEGERQRMLTAATAPVHGPGGEGALVAIPAAWTGNTASGVRVPLAGKLDQESLLRALPGEALIHPATAQRFRLKQGARVRVEAPDAQYLATVRFSDAVMQGVVEISPGETEALDLFASTHGGASRAVRVRLGRA